MDFNQTKDYANLNNTAHIYQEWVQMLDPPKLPPVQDILSESSGVPTFSEAKLAVNGVGSQLDQMINDQAHDPSDLLVKITQLWNIIFDFLDFYATISVLPNVSAQVKRGDRNLIQKLDYLDKCLANCLYKLNQLKVHGDFLAHPNAPTPSHWFILARLNAELRQSFETYIIGIQDLFAILNHDSIYKAILAIRTPDSSASSALEGANQLENTLRQLLEASQRFSSRQTQQAFSELQTLFVKADSLFSSFDTLWTAFLKLKIDSLSAYTIMTRDELIGRRSQLERFKQDAGNKLQRGIMTGIGQALFIYTQRTLELLTIAKKPAEGARTLTRKKLTTLFYPTLPPPPVAQTAPTAVQFQTLSPSSSGSSSSPYLNIPDPAPELQQEVFTNSNAETPNIPGYAFDSPEEQPFVDPYAQFVPPENQFNCGYAQSSQCSQSLNQNFQNQNIPNQSIQNQNIQNQNIQNQNIQNQNIQNQNIQNQNSQNQNFQNHCVQFCGNGDFSDLQQGQGVDPYAQFNDPYTDNVQNPKVNPSITMTYAQDVIQNYEMPEMNNQKAMYSTMSPQTPPSVVQSNGSNPLPKIFYPSLDF